MKTYADLYTALCDEQNHSTMLRDENTICMAANPHLSASEGVAILGGGLAGLAAAHVTRAPLFEAESQFGGVAISDREDGFAFDRGIHVLQTKNPRIIKLLDDLGVQLITHDRQAYIHSHGVYTPYPFQVNTAGLPLGLRIRCVLDYLRRERKTRPQNYEDWIYATIGRTFGDTFLIPYSEKFWGVHPREMTYEWTGNRVPHTSTAHVLRGAVWSKQTAVGTNAQFRYPSGGYGDIAEALARQVGSLHPGHRAVRVDARDRRVRFANGAVLSYRHLISTIPLPELIAICPEAPVDVHDAVARLRTNSIVVVNIGIGRKPRNNWHWAHFPESSASFFRLSFTHNLAPNTVPEGMSGISAEVSYTRHDPPDRKAIVQRVIEDLRRVGLMERDDPVIHTSTREIPYAYCIYDFERKQAVRTLRDWLRSQDITAAGRYGLWTNFWSDEAIMSGLQAGERSVRSKGAEQPVPHETHEAA